MKKLVLAVALTLSTLAAVSAQASTLSNPIADTVNHWPSYESGVASENGMDVIGGPNFTGGSVIFNNTPLNTGTLNSITINYDSTGLSGSLFNNVDLGDLFIDLGSNGTWDYYVDVTGAKLNGTYNILQGSIVIENNDIAYRSSNTYSFPNGNFRCDHPTELREDMGSTDIAGLGLMDTGFDAIVSGWDETNPGSVGVLTFDLNALGLDVTSYMSMTVGFTVNCANDAIFDMVTIPQDFVAPVPVPAAVWLLGSGLLGLLGLRRRA